MKVYSVCFSEQFEGEELLGVFGSREEAVEFVKSQTGYKNGWGQHGAPYSPRFGQYGVVESELGKPIDFDVTVEWLQSPLDIKSEF